MDKAATVGVRVAPHSQDMEEALLGSVLINPDQFWRVASFLKPDDFFILRNRWVWEAMGRLHERGDVIEYLTVIEELRSQERLETLGGSAYLTQLTFNITTSVHAVVYGQTIQRLAIRRRMLEAATCIVDLAYSEEKDIHTVTSEATIALEGVTRGVLRPEKTIDEIAEEAESLSEKGSLTWFLPLLAKHLGKVPSGKFLVNASRMGMGKSRWCVQWAIFLIFAGERVLFLTTEESSAEVFNKFITMNSGFLTQAHIDAGLHKSEPMKKAEYAAQKAIFTGKDPDVAGRLELVDAVNWTVEDVENRVMQHPPGTYALVIVDYIQRLGESPGFDRKRTDVELGHRAKKLKDLAMLADTVVMAPSQFNRSNAGKGQGTENISGSDAIAAEADLILGIERPAEAKTKVDVNFIKCRYRPLEVESVRVSWNSRNGTYGVEPAKPTVTLDFVGQSEPKRENGKSPQIALLDELFPPGGA